MDKIVTPDPSVLKSLIVHNEKVLLQKCYQRKLKSILHLYVNENIEPFSLWTIILYIYKVHPPRSGKLAID